MRVITSILLVITQIGCQYDLSNVEPYRSAVGREVTLSEGVKFDSHGGPGEKLIISIPEYERNGIVDLPAGTPLHVSRVERFGGLMPRVMAYGTGVMPDDKTPFAWRYTWGMSYKLFRAPWEDPATTPEIRYWGEGGRIVATTTGTAAE